MDRQLNPVYQALNKPLTLLGIDRRWFFLLISISVAVFNLSGALLPAIALFFPLFFGLRMAARIDAQILRIVFTSGRLAARYDPAKHDVGREGYMSHDGSSRAR